MCIHTLSTQVPQMLYNAKSEPSSEVNVQAFITLISLFVFSSASVSCSVYKHVFSF